MYKLVLIRHGESTWNKENRFTGWTDVDLSEKGVKEAHEAGQILKKEDFQFDLVFTSVLKRAILTMNIVLAELGMVEGDSDDFVFNVPIKYSWRLNERHYGALQGLNKTETAEKYGEEQVKIWRRSYDIQPPFLTKDDERYPGNDPIYKELMKKGEISEKDLPLTECLKDTVNRFLPYWEKEIVPEVRNGKKVLIVAHGNSLRALVKYLDNISDAEITELNIPTGVPLVYELDENLKPLKHYYLGDQEQIAAKANAVASQGKGKN